MKGGLGEVVMLVKLTLLLLTFLADTGVDGLVVPTATLPKSMLPGETLRCGLSNAGAGEASPITNKIAKLIAENAKVDVFARSISQSSREQLCVRLP
jgi:hypothetical protein